MNEKYCILIELNGDTWPLAVGSSYEDIERIWQSWMRYACENTRLNVKEKNPSYKFVKLTDAELMWFFDNAKNRRCEHV